MTGSEGLRPAAAQQAPAAGGAAGTPGLASAPSGGFGIQLGAFSSEAGASNQWRTLTDRFGRELQGLQQHIVPVDTPAGRIYRLQAIVGPEARARDICELLRKQSQGCVAVLPH
jgi:cell division septation protein DedD